MDSHAAHAGHSAAEIDKHVRTYIMVFATLLVLTMVTVAVSYLHLEVHEAITVALLIATIKASLVALFFMHLVSERQLILMILALTGAFAAVLLLLPAITNHDHITSSNMPPAMISAEHASESAAHH